MDSDDYFQCLLLQIVFQEPFVSVIIVSVIILILLYLIGLFSVGERVLSSLSLEDIDNQDVNEGVGDRFVKRLIENQAQTQVTITAMQTIHYVTLAILSVYLMYSVTGLSIQAGWHYLLLAVVLIIVLFICNSIIPVYITRNSKMLPMARAVAPAITIAGWGLRPLSVFLSKVKIKSASGDINVAKDSAEEKDMLQEIIRFYNKTTEEIMVPRMDMKAIDVKYSFDEMLDTVIETGFSRIPVYEDTEDDIKGILYVKDILHSVRKSEHLDWQELIRPAYFIPETKKIDDLLEEFRTNKNHIAIVVDEFGCTSGLVTMEDIIEEIVGDISDEYDADTRPFFVLPNGDYIFEGKIQLLDFFRETDIDPAEFGKLTEEVDTLAGLLMEIKGTLPCRREVIDYKNFRFRILEADERRVLKIKFSRIEQSKEEQVPCET